MTGALVVGFGNPLRGDDGVGWEAVAQLEADRRMTGAVVIARHQLAPELAEVVSRATVVVFVDAAVGPAGSVTVRPLRSGGDERWSHRLDPEALLALSERLYGPPPPAFAVGIGIGVGGGGLDAGEGLSPAVRGALPEVVDAVVGLVQVAGGQAEPASAG